MILLDDKYIFDTALEKPRNSVRKVFIPQNTVGNSYDHLQKSSQLQSNALF